jgi:type I restriction enzyme S subunit
VRVADFDWSRLALKLDDPTTRSFKQRQFSNLRLRPGDVLIEKSGGGEKTPVGRVVSYDEDLEAVTSNFVARIRPHKDVCNRFFLYLMAAHYMSGYSHQFIKQNTGIQNLDDANLFRSDVWVPNLTIQRQIADFLDRETSRINLLIEKKQQLLGLVASRFEALIASGRESSEWRRFGFTAIRIERPIPIDTDVSFCPLGLYNRGRGFFKKAETENDELGDSSFFFVEEGDLVFSGQFAWEGAVGLVSQSEDGCIVSHRYPVYVGRDGVLTDYLFAYFRSHHGRFLMDNCSRGAAGRNRPLNTRILEKEKIPIPSLHLQKAIGEIIRLERRLKAKLVPSVDRLKEYRSALITAAVTGQIDVSAWIKAGAIDRHLDAIQSEFAK